MGDQQMTVLDRSQLLSDALPTVYALPPDLSEGVSPPAVRKRYPFRSGTLVVELAGETEWVEPSWFLPICAKLRMIDELQDNWDGYGSSAPHSGAIGSTLIYLVGAMANRAAHPQVVPLPNGDMQLEWHRAGYDLEIVVGEQGPKSFYFCELASGEELERELHFDANAIAPYLDRVLECR
jgi:hypothetical protein